MVDRQTDRGQLLLVGGIVIAIVFLLSIVLTNSLVVTQYTATPESADQIEQIDDREEAIQRDLTTLSGSVRENTSFGKYEKRFNETLENYSTYRTTATGIESGVYINASMNLTASEGNFTEDRDPTTELRSPASGGPGPPGSGRPNWDAARNADRIVALNATVDYGSGGPSNAFLIRITGDSGDEWKVRVYDDNTGPPPDVRKVEISPPSSPSWTTECTGPTSSDAKINLINNTCSIDGSTSNFASTYDGTLTGPYEVRFEGGNKVTGTYRFAATGQFPTNTSPPIYNPSDYEPYPIVTAVDLNYSDSETGYERTILLEES